jgi:hypothetical protein
MRRVTRFALWGLAFALLWLVPAAARLAIRLYVAHAVRTFVRHSPTVEGRFTLPDGGIVRVSSTEVATIVSRIDLVSPHPFRTFVTHARYQPPSTTAEEFIGMWQGRTTVTRGFNVGGLVVVLPDVAALDFDVQRIFIRTRAGRWKQTALHFGDLAYDFDPPLLTSAYTHISPADLQKIGAALDRHSAWWACSIDSFSPERAELRLRFDAPGLKRHVLLTLTLSSDGETWQLASIARDLPGITER